MKKNRNVNNTYYTNLPAEFLVADKLGNLVSINSIMIELADKGQSQIKTLKDLNGDSIADAIKNV